MTNGVQYQQRYAPPAAIHPAMGAVSSMGIIDWSMLAGGAIVVGSGLTAVIKALPAKKKKASLVGLVVGGVVALVGGTAFVQNFNKLIA